MYAGALAWATWHLHRKGPEPTPRPAAPPPGAFSCASLSTSLHPPRLAFTRYCHYQYGMVYSIQTGGLKGILILSNNRAIVLHQGGQCGWAGGMKGWLIRAQQPRRERVSCKGQPTRRPASRDVFLCASLSTYLHPPPHPWPRWFATSR